MFCCVVYYVAAAVLYYFGAVLLLPCCVGCVVLLYFCVVVIVVDCNLCYILKVPLQDSGLSMGKALVQSTLTMLAVMEQRAVSPIARPIRLASTTVLTRRTLESPVLPL